MQIRTRIKTAKAINEFEKALEQELLSAWLELSNAVNGGLKFSDNFDAQTVTVADTGVANTEFTVSHNLKRIPTGFIVTSAVGTGVIYNGASAWTTTAIYLKSTTANNNIKVLVF